MSIPRVYLETTMFSFYYGQETTPEYRQYKADTRAVFALIKAGMYEPYTSLYALGEIEDETNREKRLNMRGLITDYGVKILEPTDETRRLAALYVQEEAVPASHPTDAAHIAITAANGLDFIVSLNFTHIARPWTDERVRRVNVREGYKGIGIYKPAEVLEL
ncbi:hypothetical protein AGMMS49944_05270 [Spirochaetia bacterium]|nr:hypothetical protein AGMMS49944_05270 [Spirochaetia bacterium]